MKVLLVSKSCVVAAHHGRLEELARMGVDLTVVTPPRWGSQALEIKRSDDYEIRVLPCWFTPHNHFHFYPARIGRIDADLVYLEEEPWSLVTYQFMRLCRKAGKPVVFFTWQNIHKEFPPPFGYFERHTFLHSQGAIAGSQGAAQILRAKGFHKPIAVVPLGVDPGVFIPREVSSLRKKLGIENVFVVGFVGRLLRAKGIEDLLRAFRMLPSDCYLAIVGDGEFRAEAESLAVRLGVNSRILWIPQVPSLEVPDYMNLLDVLVLPSRTQPNWKEQFGRVLVEAMACEVPPIGSDSGEIPNVIADAGLTFPEGDIQTLTAHLRRLYENPDLRRQLGAKGRLRVLEHYTHRRIAEQSLEFYRHVLSAQNSTQREQILA